MGLLIAFIFASLDGIADDTFEINASALLREHDVAIKVVLSRKAAMAIATGRPESLRNFPPKDFAAVRESLIEAAPRLFLVSANGLDLVPAEPAVALTSENEVVFRLSYPRPASGRLSLNASLGSLLSNGYVGVLRVHDESAGGGGATVALNDQNAVVAIELEPAAGPLPAAAAAHSVLDPEHVAENLSDPPPAPVASPATARQRGVAHLPVGVSPATLGAFRLPTCLGLVLITAALLLVVRRSVWAGSSR